MPSEVPRPTGPPARPEPPPSAGSFRRFLARSEAATLVGMLLVVFSIYLVWERHVLPRNMIPLAGNMYLSEAITRTGQALLPPVTRWLLLGCAVACTTLLLWIPTAKTRLALAVVNGACALACVLIALTWLMRSGLQPGIVMALVGGMLLTFGALDRLSALEPGGRK